ncbi:MAG: polyprenyl synthetase family protein [Planctomycetes bacterium]|nr:polyprenyl synthetase family protein [Planctomycetota bacterium]
MRKVKMNGLLMQLATDPTILRAFSLQREILKEFHRRAEQVLDGQCGLRPYSIADCEIKRNIFSTLFLATQQGLGLSEKDIKNCGIISQCMRAWVTGCDNILDDEFKEVIPLDLPEGGTKFQSVLMIMVADRILCDLLLESSGDGNFDLERCRNLSHKTLGVLMPSGLQEHEEEIGASEFMSPEIILKTIHRAKTGLLFEAPLAIAEWFMNGGNEQSRMARSGLHAFGLACQILDDIVDAEKDFAENRHNYVLSLAVENMSIESGRKVNRTNLSWSDFDLEPVYEKACRDSCDKFEEARIDLKKGGLRLQPESWNSLVRLIPMLLRVPEGIKNKMTEAVECITG